MTQLMTQLLQYGVISNCMFKVRELFATKQMKEQMTYFACFQLKKQICYLRQNLEVHVSHFNLYTDKDSKASSFKHCYVSDSLPCLVYSKEVLLYSFSP